MPDTLCPRWKSAVVLLAMGAALAGCSTARRTPAPIEDRAPVARTQPATVAGTTAAPADAATRLPPGAENAGKPGYYTVRPGDTIIRIALDSGQNWRDLARWNNLDNPNLIEVGQVLRIVAPVAPVAAAAPPASATSSTSPATAASTDGVVSRPVTPSAPVTGSPVPPAGATAAPSVPRSGTGTLAGPAVAGASAPASAPSGAAVTPAPAAASANLPPVPAADEQVAWGWPAPGNTNVVANFDEVKNKGIAIAGRAGDPVLASADGRVVYAGAGLRGYGNLIILKHNNTYLTAYAHNQTLLVKEDQSVRKGQKIAEMGSTDSDRVALHFEIRRQGKPVDPTRFLPMR